jgi:hypothetical protein
VLRTLNILRLSPGARTGTPYANILARYGTWLGGRGFSVPLGYTGEVEKGELVARGISRPRWEGRRPGMRRRTVCVILALCCGCQLDPLGQKDQLTSGTIQFGFGPSAVRYKTRSLTCATPIFRPCLNCPRSNAKDGRFFSTFRSLRFSSLVSTFVNPSAPPLATSAGVAPGAGAGLDEVDIVDGPAGGDSGSFRFEGITGDMLDVMSLMWEGRSVLYVYVAEDVYRIDSP